MIAIRRLATLVLLGFGFGIAPASAIELTVIGYDIDSGSKEEQQLRDMAAAAGGRYLSVMSGQPGQLATAIMQGTGILPVGPLGPAAASSGPEREPNNRYSESNAVTPQAGVTATIQPRGDRDFFRVRVSHQGELTISVTEPPQQMALWFEVYNGDYNRIAGPFYAARDGAENVGSADLPEPGNYWVQIGDRHDRGESAETYHLNFAFIPTVDHLEPNPSIGRAARIPASGAFQAAILPRGDRDWYRLEVADQGQLDIRVKEPPENLDLWVEVYDADAKRIAGPFYAARRGVENFAAADLRQAGVYTLHIGDRHDSERSVKPYTVETEFTSTGDDNEPNPSFSKGKMIPASGSLRAAILPRGDRDWYRFEVDDQGRLDVQIKAPPEDLDLWIEVYDANLNRIAGPFYAARRGMENSANADLPEAGVYGLHIGDRHDAKRAVKPYTLETAFIPTQDSLEPNPSFGLAPLIPLSGLIQAAVLPRGDRDWYRVSVQRPGMLSLALTSVPENLALWMEVYDADKRRIGGPFYAAREGADNFAEVSLPSAGDYVIHLGALHDRESSPERYALTTKFTPAP